MAIDMLTLKQAKKYVDETLTGAGALKGKDGVDGKSAYQIALDKGFVGTEEEWLESLNTSDKDLALVEQTLGYAVKNILYVNSGDGTMSGITYTKQSDKSFIINGTPTKDIGAELFADVYLNRGKEYILSGCPKGGSLDTYYIELTYTINDVEYTFNDTGDTVKFRVDEDVTASIRLRFKSGVLIENVTMSPMLRRAEIEDDTYEPCEEQVIRKRLSDAESNIRSLYTKVGNCADRPYEYVQHLGLTAPCTIESLCDALAVGKKFQKYITLSTVTGLPTNRSEGELFVHRLSTTIYVIKFDWDDESYIGYYDVDGVVWNKIVTEDKLPLKITSLSQLGVSAPCTTLDIIDALEALNRAITFETTASNTVITDLPIYGTLSIYIVYNGSMPKIELSRESNFYRGEYNIDGIIWHKFIGDDTAQSSGMVRLKEVPANSSSDFRFIEEEGFSRIHVELTAVPSNTQDVRVCIGTLDVSVDFLINNTGGCNFIYSDFGRYTQVTTMVYTEDKKLQFGDVTGVSVTDAIFIAYGIY